MNEADLMNFEVGAAKPFWIFVDNWNTNKSNHKDGDIFRVNGILLQSSNDGKTEFPTLELTKIIAGEEIAEDFRISAFALKKNKTIKAKNLIGKKIQLKKVGSRLYFDVVE